MRVCALCLLLVSAPVRSRAAAPCTTASGEEGKCDDTGCCLDSNNRGWDLADLGGTLNIPGPQGGPDGKKYVFSLYTNVADPPRVCQQRDKESYNALEYDDSVDDPSCVEIGCDIDRPPDREGLHVVTDGDRGLLFQYINYGLGESWLQANLTCTLPVPDDISGLGFPENLHQNADGKYLLTWQTAYVCPGVCTGAPGPHMNKVAGTSEVTATCVEGYSLSEGSAGYKCTEGVWKLNGDAASAATCNTTQPPSPPQPEPEPEPEPSPPQPEPEPEPEPSPPQPPSPPHPGSEPEPEPPTSHTKAIVAVVLLLLAGGVAGFVFLRGGRLRLCTQSAGPSMLDEHLDDKLNADAEAAGHESIGGSE